MIKRYTRKAMGDIWTDENRYMTWLKVELLACEAMAEMGKVPKEALQNIKRASFSVKRIKEIEAETKHDVIAFLTAVAERVGPDARYIHMGLTSSDVLDTSMAFLMKQAGSLILKDCERLLGIIRKRAFEHKDTVMVGRSHGIHAEPITFGLKLAVWYDEMRRNQGRFERAVETISFGKLSGAVGTFANTPPEVEAYVCRKLNLKPAPASTQIIQRDRYGEYFTALAIMGSSIEKMAIEIRHLQRTEVLEAEEFFSKGQKGSSAMPHKRNPIGSENLSGLARIIRSNAMAALENIPLWHERDISHSSVERIIAPDSTILMDYMLNRISGIIKNLVVYPKTMEKNLGLLKGLVFSQQVLLALAAAGISREDAYETVQTHAMRVWKEKQDFKTLIINDEKILEHVSRKKIEEIFDVNYHLKYISAIFDRVFG
ncbi:MAG: adenylosuccinate lyase [Desulfobacterales bacterium]|jgi:adenylosuccinate lyase|nr:adenylosuccinate lyase [Desulfobacter sp.]MDP6394534.1 adenylosuccinate lyase [Desulfobacterales bacterium]MDP6683779.1 adenylosuccinate lyase [Desulfobacterales bacterium]MDP6806168.1 adenylosuccinate lyase [Desulfobacterales bacterium]|tara:strand:+ start:60725 stop:62014 length:1290 start_codon:yes stop_codon:yes gene_type:complete